MSTLIDRVGQRYGRLTVIARSARVSKKTYWTCRCDCGIKKEISAIALQAKRTSSCGCLNNELRRQRATTHGRAGSKEHRCWQHLKSRCTNPKDKQWSDYGGRGITVCNQWVDSFEAFFDHMGEAPSAKHSIDRINNDGPYSPDNCRWATPTEQASNRRSSLKLTYNGVVYPTFKDLASSVRVKEDSLFYFFHKKNLPLEEALNKADRI